MESVKINFHRIRNRLYSAILKAILHSQRWKIERNVTKSTILNATKILYFQEMNCCVLFSHLRSFCRNCKYKPGLSMLSTKTRLLKSNLNGIVWIEFMKVNESVKMSEGISVSMCQHLLTLFQPCWPMPCMLWCVNLHIICGVKSDAAKQPFKYK